MGFFDRLFGRSRAAGAAERQEADARKRADRREADAQGGADWQAADAREDASSRKDAAVPRERQPEAGKGVGPAGQEKAGEPSPDQEAAPPVLRVGNIQGIGGREHQEDSFAVRNSSDLEGQQRQGLLAVVADGMGGMAGGEYASQCAVDTLTQRFADWEGEPPAPNWLYAGAFAASEQVFGQFGGMSGTTLIAVHIRENLLHWVSVGDSAIFLMRNGGVFQLNREHTYLNQLYARELAEETIDRSRAELDIDARRLTSFVGIDHLKEVDLNLRPWHLRRGDVLLLCSDGISGVLSPPELKEAMSLEPDAGCALLETMVLEKQILEQDNYTGILIAYR